LFVAFHHNHIAKSHGFSLIRTGKATGLLFGVARK
jgi:hypothetical protein